MSLKTNVARLTARAANGDAKGHRGGRMRAALAALDAARAATRRLETCAVELHEALGRPAREAPKRG